MNLLIIREGYTSVKPPDSFFEENRINKVFLLYLSPRVKAFEYRDELRSVVKENIEIEIINPKDLLDFAYLRKALRDFIAYLPEQLRIGNSSLTEYLNIHGLNMWWASGVVEATPYKRDLLQNLYYLSAIRSVLEKFAISQVWFEVESQALKNDLALMLNGVGIKYNYGKKINRLSGIKSSLMRAKLWLFFFGAHLIYALFFRALYPRRLRPPKIKNNQKNIHLFWTYYPTEVRFRNNIPEAKLYQELPLVLSRELGGDAYYLSYLSSASLSYFFRMIKDMQDYWQHNFRLIPMDIYVGFRGLFRIFLSLERRWKYFRLSRVPQYRTIFIIEGISLFHTFDGAIKESLMGTEAYTNFLHFYAFRGFSKLYKKNIYQVVYPVEFHNWEVALICGIKNADRTIPVVGLQQSAPNPILLNFFFTPVMFKNKRNSYPLPDLLLSSGGLYKELMLSGGIDSQRVQVTGHIFNRYLHNLPLSVEEKYKKRLAENIPVDRRICLIPVSISVPLTKAVIYLLKDVVRKVPDVLFLIKEHPQCPVMPLLCEFDIDALDNVLAVQQPIEILLPLADCFLSLSTSVSQEALSLGLPQVNLDVAGLPWANPLHLIPGLIQDVETPDELLDFFLHTEKFKVPNEKASLFIGNPGTDACQNFLDAVREKFHKYGPVNFKENIQYSCNVK